ncbi:MFS transporter [Kibdelosporangium persicum]|uniref:Multidrug resistance protein stp n=1 Tax=Kibdelosporangium persicum TaxID=2698649 RepID=A0ABX2FIB4_9PSEU|nr:MFS transporter [Kibdelosporangium persicum]NRN71142.1 Multidrug resistance protein stp [Kibdelosporangium persicum]
MDSDPRAPTVSATATRASIGAVLLASFFLPFAVTGPAIVLPDMAADLNASSAGTQWVQNSYNAIFAATVLATGSLADRFGRRLVLRIGIATFGLAMALIAVSSDILVIDVLRGVQGLAAGATVSAGSAVLAHATSGPRRVRVFGFLGASFGGGTAAGPLVAGALAPLGWRSIFVVIALGAAIAFVASRYARESSDPSAPRPDLPGMACFGGALLVLSLGFIQAGEAGWSNVWTLLAFVATILLLGAFVLVELRSSHPMFDVRLFRRPAFTALMCLPFSVTFGLAALNVFLPVFLQSGGASPWRAAVELTPLELPVLLVPLAARWLTSRWSMRTLLVAGPVVIAAGSFGLVVVERDTSTWVSALPLLLFGVGVGMAFSVMDNAAVSAVPVGKAGAAAGMFNTMRITGESLAVAATAAVLISITAARTSTAQAVAAVQGRPVPVPTGQAFAAALHVVVIGLGVLAVVGAILTAWALRTSHDTEADEAHAGTQ